ncbi:MAG: hypothetical protein O2931_07860 [Planctomycetota bacterium]|nr:hypothetical protein [Planctomycetota bacterium]MDA1178696.1 hypothetical protein [Planctomycetota bacterium]
MPIDRYRFFTNCCLWVLLASVVGRQRQPPRATIAGQVTYQGKPVAFGDIVFEPIGDKWKGFYCQHKIIDGKYSINENGPIVGKNRIEIHGYRQTNQVVPDISGRRLNEAPAMANGLLPYIPSEYNDQSDMTIDIVAGQNENRDFQLK